jgi:6-phospho-beta-glucosidase
MDVVIMGGSAQSTPGLWSYLVNEARLRDLRIRLAGRDRRRLEAVRRACLLLARPGANRLECALLDGPEAWERLAGADLFLIQVRDGGYAGRSHDEAFPLRYGVCGDEGLGPGGLSAGMRNWRAIRPALENLARLGTSALIVMLSSPVGLLVRAASLEFPRIKVAGICELPWTTLRDVCRAVNAHPSEVEFDYLGVNHLGWLYQITAGGRDLVAEYARARKPEAGFPSADLVRSCGGVPLRYLRLHYEQERVVEEQRRQRRTRGDELELLRRAAFRAYRAGGRRDVRAALEARPAPWYRHAVGPLISSLAGKATRIPFFLSVRNAGYDPYFDDGDVLECAHAVDHGQIRRLVHSAPVSQHILQLVARFVRYERLATEALVGGALRALREAIRVHPWSERVPRPGRMVREIVDFCRGAAA